MFAAYSGSRWSSASIWSGGPASPSKPSPPIQSGSQIFYRTIPVIHSTVTSTPAMAQSNIRWEKDGCYIVASRLPVTPGPSTALPPALTSSASASSVSDPGWHFSFFLTWAADGSRGRWITVDTVADTAGSPATAGPKLINCEFPTKAVPRFPWPDHAGRVPHAVAHVATWSSKEFAEFDASVKHASYKAGWSPGTTVLLDNVEWFLSMVRFLNGMKLLNCPDAWALLTELKNEGTRPIEGALSDVSGFCVQGGTELKSKKLPVCEIM